LFASIYPDKQKEESKMRKNKPKPVPPPHPKGIPNVPVPHHRSGWRVMTGVQLSLYDIPGIQTIHIGGVPQ